MERLQAAIEKARERRGALDQSGTAPAGGPGTAPKRASDHDPWFDLKDLPVDKNRLVKQRIVTLQADLAAAPYDVMRTRMLHQMRKNNWTRVAIVSPHNSSGKTTVSANLAFGLSRNRDIRTIVMDLDLRRNGLSHLFDLNDQTSMADVLEGNVDFADVAMRYGQSLAFGLGPRVVPNAGEVLLGAHTQDALDSIQARYTPDLMLFDMPPLNVGDDNLGFLTRVDAALIVVEAERTTVSQVDVAENQVSDLTNVMGIVLNKSRYVSGAYAQQDYYY